MRWAFSVSVAVLFLKKFYKISSALVKSFGIGLANSLANSFSLPDKTWSPPLLYCNYNSVAIIITNIWIRDKLYLNLSRAFLPVFVFCLRKMYVQDSKLASWKKGGAVISNIFPMSTRSRELLIGLAGCMVCAWQTAIPGTGRIMMLSYKKRQP